MISTTRMTTRIETEASEACQEASPSPSVGTAGYAPRNPPSDVDVDRELSGLAGRRVAIALSGGVDSAVAAERLVRAGADVVGLALRLHDPDPDNPLAPRACCPPDDLQDARRVAEHLGFPFYVIDARAAFSQSVVAPFVSSYLRGKTPNPCVGCNAFVKLERLHRRAQALGCHRLATGHYARSHPGEARLFRGVDTSKDQSYFLFGTAPEILRDLVFPLGAWTKAEVRGRALKSGLPVAHKLESQEVCFVGGAGAGAFVMRQAEARGTHSGRIVDEAGTQLGEHRGVMHFTVGQRKGLGVAARHPLHVLSIDAGSRTVTVGPADRLFERGLVADQASWPAGAPDAAIEVLAKIRYRDRGAEASVRPTPDGGAEVSFRTPVKAISPGQATVFYRGDEVVGGAWIREARDLRFEAGGSVAEAETTA